MVAEPSSNTAIAPSLPQTIQVKVKTLPPELQQQVLDFVEFLSQKSARQPERNLWEVLDDAAANIPDQERVKMPSDGSYQHDHYLYGTQKREL
jgi:hypothetical protein